MASQNIAAAVPLETARGSFRVTLDGDPAAPALILSNSLGTTLEMWNPQVESLSRDYRLIRYDTRGHGGSPITPGPYRFADLGQDVLAILDALELQQALFCGISMGGHTGLWLGIHAGARWRGIAVCNSAARIGTPQAWNERADLVRRGGADSMQALADSAAGRWFTEDFVRAHPDAVQRAQRWLAGIDPQGYAACCEALATSDLSAEVAGISTSTLLLAGASDPVTTVAEAQALHAVIRGSRLAVVPASHLSNLEAPQAFERALRGFFATLAPV